MNPPANRESLPAVTVAGVVAIIFSALGVLLGLLVEVSMLVAPGMQASAGMPAIPPGTRAAVAVFWLFGLAVAVFGFFVGIGVFRRRNWARIAMLIWGGIMAVLSALSIALIFVVFNSVPFALPSGAEAGPFMAFLKVFMFFSMAYRSGSASGGWRFSLARALLRLLQHRTLSRRIRQQWKSQSRLRRNLLPSLPSPLRPLVRFPFSSSQAS